MSLLGLYFTFHMIGLVLWLGAAFLLPIAILPAVRSLEAGSQLKYLEVITQRYTPWFIVGGVLVGLTGLGQTLQMLGNLNMPAIIAKHIAILPLIAVSGYIWFYLARKLAKTASDNGKLWTQLVVLAWIQAGLGVIVLVLTGWLTS